MANSIVFRCDGCKRKQRVSWRGKDDDVPNYCPFCRSQLFEDVETCLPEGLPEFFYRNPLEYTTEVRVIAFNVLDPDGDLCWAAVPDLAVRSWGDVFMAAAYLARWLYDNQDKKPSNPLEHVYSELLKTTLNMKKGPKPQ